MRPDRPALYDAENQRRSEYQSVRYNLLTDDFDDDIDAFLSSMVGEETAEHWGLPDTALNPMSASTKQLVTPGLYGYRPTVHCQDDDGQRLVGRSGYIGHVWGRNQWVQYLSVGIGIVFRRLHAVGKGDTARIVDRIVLPHNVVTFCEPDDPTRIVALWELRLRSHGDETYYAWDQWDTRNGGSLRVVRVTRDVLQTEDVSLRHLTAEVDGVAVAGPLTGSLFPCHDRAGNAVLPWVAYRAIDTGEQWPDWRRSMHRGTLRSCAHWTYTSRAALFATGEFLILAGPNPDAMPGAIRRGDAGSLAAQAGNTATGQPLLPGSAPSTAQMRVQPGMILTLPMDADKSLQSVSVGPGVNLPNLSNFANEYAMRLHVADGLHPTDSTRQSANPTSGAALEISSRSRREFAAQVRPFFEAADLQTIAVATWLLDSVGVTLPDPDLYSITYHTIPLSPTEQEDLRADLEWQQSQGQIGPIDVHLSLYPGKTPAQAEADVIRARVESARIDALVKEQIAALGIGEDPEDDPAEEPEEDPAEDPEDMPADPEDDQPAQ